MKRIIYFDLLRIVAIVSVVFVHVSAQYWHSADVYSYEWNIYNVFDALSRFGVPVFVMISGALFLGREQKIEKLFKKNILKIVTIFLFWSLIYALYQLFFKETIERPADFIVEFLKGPYHFWFLFMIVGLYIIVPLLRKIVVDEKMTRYFLALAFIFAFAIPMSTYLIEYVSPRTAETLNYIIDSTKLNFVLGFSGYFVLGYYLNKVRISKKSEYIIYALGALGAIITIVGTMILSRVLNEATPFFYTNATINVMLVAVAVFIFFKKHLNKQFNEKTEKRILFLSKCTLGIYVVHILVMFVLRDSFNFTVESFNPIFSIPVLGMVITLISFALTAVLVKIPVLNRWIV